MNQNQQRNLWAANPHEYGPGKVHIIDDEEPRKTYCGRFLEAIPGSPLKQGRATCKTCLNGVVARPERRAQQETYEREYAAIRAAEEAQRAEDRREWFSWYSTYLRSPAWRERSASVIRRAGGVCEGCGKRPATQAHHPTYVHVGDEFLWELRAVCKPCHDRFHADREG